MQQASYYHTTSVSQLHHAAGIHW